MLPGGERGADAGVRGGNFAPLGVCRLLLTWMIVASATASAAACSRIPSNPSPKYLFEHSTSIFRGIATSAEVIDLGNTYNARIVGDYGPREIGYVFVKVKWQVTEVFKGTNPQGKAAGTSYICGGVFVHVGQPYVFTLSAGDDLEKFGMIGLLDDAGTKGAWESAEEYNKLIKEFRALSGK
jgi:hypothetical protein